MVLVECDSVFYFWGVLMIRVFLVAISLLLPEALLAAIIWIPADYQTIQQGVNAADEGDLIFIENGEYAESNIMINKALTISSPNGEVGHVTIAREGSGSIFTAQPEGGLVCFRGLVIQDGVASVGSGAGLNFRGGQLEIQNCRFQNNRTFGTGGGIALTEAAAIIVSSEFYSNYAQYGGSGIHCLESSVEIVECVFSDGTGQYGSGIKLQQSNGIITASAFLDNTASRGAGIFCNVGTDCRIDECTFVSNHGLRGCIHLDSGSFTSISGSTFYDNSSNDSENGAAIHVKGWSSVEIETSILWDDSVREIHIEGEEGAAEVECSNVRSGFFEGVNISDDPLFCDPAVRDLYLRNDSPCAPENNDCGVLMGAWPVGCSTSIEALTWSKFKSLY